jgi:hypothetical protein
MSIKVAFLAFFLLLAPSPLWAKSPGIIVKQGETWIFAISRGEPVRARQVLQADKPERGEVQVTVSAMMGTTMTITNNNSISYTYRAELLGAGKRKANPSRTCTLPAKGKLAIENWPQKATAVRLSNFKPAPSGGSCP